MGGQIKNREFKNNRPKIPSTNRTIQLPQGRSPNLPPCRKTNAQRCGPKGPQSASTKENARNHAPLPAAETRDKLKNKIAASQAVARPSPAFPAPHPVRTNRLLQFGINAQAQSEFPPPSLKPGPHNPPKRIKPDLAGTPFALGILAKSGGMKGLISSLVERR